MRAAYDDFRPMTGWFREALAGSFGGDVRCKSDSPRKPCPGRNRADAAVAAASPEKRVRNALVACAGGMETLHAPSGETGEGKAQVRPHGSSGFRCSSMYCRGLTPMVFRKTRLKYAGSE